MKIQHSISIEQKTKCRENRQNKSQNVEWANVESSKILAAIWTIIFHETCVCIVISHDMFDIHRL